MDRPSGYGSYEEDKHNTTAGGLQSTGDQGQLHRDDPQQQHEKKSVLTKVKDKAKKLKDNITHKHGHGHDHDLQAENEEYEDEDEDIEEDPGAPIYDSHQSATSQGFLPSHAVEETTIAPPPTTQDRLSAPMTTPVTVGHTDPTTNVSTGLATESDPEEASRSFIPGQVGVTTPLHDGVTFGGSQTPHSSVITTPQQQHSSGALPGIKAPETTEEHIFVPKNTAPSPMAAAGAGIDAPAGGYNGKPSSLTQTQNPSQGAMDPSAPLGAALETPRALGEDPRGPGRVHEPDNYQSKVTDRTGMGGEEIGVAGANPVMRALDKMKIYDEPSEQGTGSHNQLSPEPISSCETNPSLQNPQDTGSQFTDASSRTEHDHVHEAGSKKESTYMDKVSSATSVIVGKATQAKNVVASKLGYGGGDDQAVEGEVGIGGKMATSSVGEYGKQDADRGVSVKEYIVEKISPGEEDKALSEVITGAFPLHNTSKEGRQTGGAGAHKVDPEGRVTLSETVASRLGGGTPEEKGSGNTTGTTGAGVVDKIKEAATGWFGKGGETQPSSTAFHDNTEEEDDATQGIARGVSKGDQPTRTVREPGL